MGRERELEVLESFLKAAVEGKGKTIFVSGEAGSGKTKLVCEFLGSATKKGVTVLAGWCLSDAAVPYFPFIEAFDAYFASGEEPLPSLQQSFGGIGESTHTGVAGRELATWLSGTRMFEKTGRVEPLSPQVWKDQAFDRVAKTLLTISGERPLILFLEDMHWADSASLALLHYISRVVNGSERILILATFRSEEVTADAEGRPHRLEEEMRVMSREDLYSEIKLPNLSQTHVSMIAQNMMGGSVQPELVEKIAKEGNGNALFLVESLRMLVEQSGLVQENNEWRLAVDDFGIPSKIRDIILRRLAVLKYSQRRVLDAASVIGEKFNVELLAAVLNQDSLDVLDTLNFIAQSTAIVTDEGALFKFDHARSREVLYDALSSSLKTGYHARVAEKLESGAKSPKLPFADLAYHYTQAGNDEKALKYSLEAGQEALARFSNEEAIKSFQYVVDKVADNGSNIAQKTAALEGLGDALYAGNNFRQAREAFEQLAQLQKNAAKLRALRKAIVATFYEINPPKIKELTRQAEENASADRVEAARVLSHKARINAVQGEYVDCYPLLQEAISVYEEEYCLSDAAWDLFAMSNVHVWSGELEKGVASALRSIALSDELGDIHARLEAYLYAGHCFAYCGFVDEAQKFYRKLVEIDNTFKANDYVRLVPAIMTQGIILLLENLRKDLSPGKLAETKTLGLKVLSYCNKSDSVYQRSIGSVYAFLAGISILEGNIDIGEEYYKKLMNLPPGMRANVVYVNPMSAIYFASKNRFDEANESIEKLLNFEKRLMPSPGLEASVKGWGAWVLEKEGRLEESRRMLQESQRLIDGAQKKFAHFEIYPGLMTFIHPEVDQLFELRLDVVNASTREGSILWIENLLVPSLKIVGVSPNCVLKGGRVRFKDNKMGRFSVKTVRLTVTAANSESFILAPAVTYMDDLGQTKTRSNRTFRINVQPKLKKAQVVGKIATGFDELDRLLYGGIPEGYAIALTASSSDELAGLIEQYVEASAKNGQITYYLTDELRKGEGLAKDFPSNFRLFVCSPRADSMANDLPNVFMLKGVEDLTAIDSALTKASRQLITSGASSRLICIEITSDVLLRHHAVNTKKWLSGLIQDLKSNGFTILATVDPQMLPPEELQAILSIFDGEIRITEKETPEGTKQVLKIKKLINQKYSATEITLNKEISTN